MPKYGKQQERARRRDAKKVASSGDDLYEAPEKGLCHEQNIPVEMDDPRYRMFQRLVSHRKRLVEYAIVLTERVGEDEWSELYSVDSRHGWVHEHKSGHRRANDRVDIQPLYSQVDVQESFDTAYQLVHERYLRLRQG